MVSHSRKIGDQAEEHVLHFLQAQGLKPIARNWQDRSGEIDLIMQDSDEIVFVEVRIRQNNLYGNAIESVDTRKQTRLIRTSQHWLLRHHRADNHSIRYDIVGISEGKLEWVKSAFNAGEQ